MINRTSLKNNIATMISGTLEDDDLDIIVNRAVREVVSDSDLRSCIRRAALSPNLFDEIYQYAAPSDLKGDKIIDIKPQVNRFRNDYWRKTTAEEFDRYKQDLRTDGIGDPIRTNQNNWNGESIMAVQDSDVVKKVLLSRPIDDDSISLDPLTTVGSWVLFGDGENVTSDSANYVKGSASVNWDISSAGGTTAGIQNSAIPSTDISAYLSEGSIFVWAYLSSKTNVTNFIIRVGSSSTVYNSITITTNNEGTAFVNGWNLLRFDLVNKVLTGTPTNTAITYAALYMTKDAGKVSETDYRFNWLVLKKGEHFDLVYYSKYGWQSVAGSYLENSTIDTDYVNADTDEQRLIEYKAAELGEVHLRSSQTTIKEKRDLYEGYMQRYAMKNPSLVTPVITTYSNINYL
jgi:hypothetical protein